MMGPLCLDLNPIARTLSRDGCCSSISCRFPSLSPGASGPFHMLFPLPRTVFLKLFASLVHPSLCLAFV